MVFGTVFVYRKRASSAVKVRQSVWGDIEGEINSIHVLNDVYFHCLGTLAPTSGTTAEPTETTEGILETFHLWIGLD